MSALRRYDCCEHCEHDINDPPHDRPCPAGCVEEHGPGMWSSGPSLVQLDAGAPRSQIPGWEGSIGPGPAQYHLPHVYARNVHSGAGNCVCGAHLGDSRHVQAAPGVPVPDGMRT